MQTSKDIVINTNKLSTLTLELKKTLKRWTNLLDSEPCDFPRYFIPYIDFVTKHGLEKEIYPDAEKYFEKYEPEEISEQSIRCFFIFSQLCYVVHKDENNFSKLWLSQILYKHCLLNNNTFDITKIQANEDYLESQNMHMVWQVKIDQSVIVDISIFKRNRSSHQTSYIPDEILFNILSFLGVKDLVKSSRINSQFYRVSHDKKLWEALEENHFIKDIKYINHFRKQYKYEKFILSAKNRIIDFHVGPKIKFSTEGKFNNQLDQHPRLQTAWDNISKSVLFTLCCLPILGGLGWGIYMGFCYYSDAQDDMDEDMDMGYRVVSATMAAAIATCFGSAVTLLALFIAGCLLHLCYKGITCGVETIANAVGDPLDRFRITDSSGNINSNMLYAPTHFHEGERDPLISHIPAQSW